MNTLFVIIEYIGIISFTVSGAMVSIRKEADLFGVVLLSVMTAFFGGIVRDLCLGITPPGFFVKSGIKVFVSICTALLVFALAAIFKKGFVKNEEKVNALNNIFDAAGLGIFAVLGVQMTVDAGQNSAFIAIVLGLLSGIGGGMFRDIALGTIPFVIKKRVYAVACICGAAVYYFLSAVLDVRVFWSMLLGVLVTFTMRMCATIFKWNMPKAIRFSDFE